MIEGNTVHCDNPACEKVLELWYPPDNARVWEAMTHSTWARLGILDGGWLVDLHGPDESILVGQEEHIPNNSVVGDLSVGGFSPERLTKIVAEPQYDFDKDQHYCSLECVAVTA